MGDKRYRVGGTRGGQDQFKWEDVKSDAHRENYLGHSLLAPVGRWQRGKDLKWWNKKGEEGGADAARAQAEIEKARVKQLDEDLLNEALGLAPKTVRTPQGDLSAAEKKQLLEKGATMDRDGANTERVSGLGAGPAKHHEHIPSLTLKEKELQRLQREQELKEGGLTEASLVEIVDYEKEQRDLAAKAAAGAGVGASRKRLREEQRAKKREKKEKKRAKKEKKKEKRRLKKAKKNEQEKVAGISGRDIGGGGVDKAEQERLVGFPSHDFRGGGFGERNGRPEQHHPRSRDEESLENGNARRYDESTRNVREPERQRHYHGRDQRNERSHSHGREHNKQRRLLHTSGGNGNPHAVGDRGWPRNGEDNQAVGRGRGEVHGREQGNGNPKGHAGGDGGWKHNGADRQAADWGRGEAHGRERDSRLPAKRQRSRSPVAWSNRTTQRREEGRGTTQEGWGARDWRNEREEGREAKEERGGREEGRGGRGEGRRAREESRGERDSRNDRGRQEKNPRTMKESRETGGQQRDGGRVEEGQAKRARSASRSRRGNSSSSSSSSSSNSSSSSSEGGKSNASKSCSRSRDDRGRRRSAGNQSSTRDPSRDTPRSAPGAGRNLKGNAHGTRNNRSRSRSRSRSTERRPGNGKVRESTPHGDGGSRRRVKEDGRERHGRNGKR